MRPEDQGSDPLGGVGLHGWSDVLVVAAAALAFRVSRAQAFGEGNKRTALLLARWLLDRNGIDGRVILPPDDHAFGDYLVNAASGHDVEADMIRLLQARA